jgi:hypothetical protein
LSAGIGAAAGWAIKLALPPLHPIVVAIVVLGPYGVTYLALTLVTGVDEARTALTRFTSR